MSLLYPVPDYKNFVNYAHRGASEYAPENTMISFHTGIFMGANGIETDVRRTRDGVLVLFHDGDLTRVTGEQGSIADYTYAELQKFSVKKGDLTDKIVRLEDFLREFAWRDLTFAIELKDAGTEDDTAELIYKYRAEEKTVITSFHFDYIVRMRRAAPALRCGFLCTRPTEEQLAEMAGQGIGEICPKAVGITAADVGFWHERKLNVRAWGVSDGNVMRRAVEAGVDGMTVNFPDRLTAYMTERQTR